MRTHVLAVITAVGALLTLNLSSGLASQGPPDGGFKAISLGTAMMDSGSAALSDRAPSQTPEFRDVKGTAKTRDPTTRRMAGTDRI